MSYSYGTIQGKIFIDDLGRYAYEISTKGNIEQRLVTGNEYEEVEAIIKMHTTFNNDIAYFGNKGWKISSKQINRNNLKIYLLEKIDNE